MTDFTRGLDRRTFIFGAAALGAATLLRPTLAFAEPTSADKFAEADSVRARINEMQDVYKRQLCFPPLILAVNIAEAVVRDFQVFSFGLWQGGVVENLWTMSGPWNIMNGIAAVSYTHLDVYKRQL